MTGSVRRGRTAFSSHVHRSDHAHRPNKPAPFLAQGMGTKEVHRVSHVASREQIEKGGALVDIEGHIRYSSPGTAIFLRR